MRGRYWPIGAHSPDSENSPYSWQRKSDWNLSFILPDEQGHVAYPADHASNDFEQGLYYRLRTRVITKLKRLEPVLLLLRTKRYGYCRSCRKPIPDARLAVQPEALLCVPCLAHIERRACETKLEHA